MPQGVLERISAHARKIDWMLAAVVLFICGTGLAMLYDLSASDGNFLFLKKQAAFVVLGFLLALVISLLDFRIFKDHASPVLLIYFLGVLMLVLLFLFGTSVKGTLGWYRMGHFGFESVEFVKLALVLLLAKYFSVRHAESYRFAHIAVSGAYAALPVALVLLQPDFGSAMILALVWFGMVLFSGIKFHHLVILAVLASVVFAGGWMFTLKSYQKERVLSFFDPQFDPHGASYNILQSLASFGTGGALGKGYGNGVQGRFGFLPEAKTDFIFPAYVETFGFVGAAVLFAAYMFLLLRVLKIGQRASNNFGRLLCSGFAMLVLIHVIINIGMTLNLFPVIGIPLPFMSYGGSNLSVMFLGIAVVFSVGANTAHQTVKNDDFIMPTVVE